MQPAFPLPEGWFAGTGPEGEAKIPRHRDMNWFEGFGQTTISSNGLNIIESGGQELYNQQNEFLYVAELQDEPPHEEHCKKPQSASTTNGANQIPNVLDHHEVELNHKLSMRRDTELAVNGANQIPNVLDHHEVELNHKLSMRRDTELAVATATSCHAVQHQEPEECQSPPLHRGHPVTELNRQVLTTKVVPPEKFVPGCRQIPPQLQVRPRLAERIEHSEKLLRASAEKHDQALGEECNSAISASACGIFDGLDLDEF
eukprot:s1084_g10.t2